MINFNHFKKFDRIKSLDPYEQQRHYWMFRNDMLNPLSIRGGGAGAGAGASSGGKKTKPPTSFSSNFSFFTKSGFQFTTIIGDIVLKSTTGYAKAFYPYDIQVGVFGGGDPNTQFSIVLTDTTPWNGALPFKIFSCDIDGNLTGDITYIKFDNLNNLTNLDLTYCKDDVIEVDVAGCVDLTTLTIPSSVSLTNLNVSNTQVQELDINGCEYLEYLDITSTTFKPVYTLDLTGIISLISINGNNCNLFSLITSALTLEEVSLNDCVGLSQLICDGFTGNGGLSTIQIKNCSLGPGALDNLYTSLGIANGSNKTIFVFGNTLSGSDPSIATGKGYTVDTNP